MPALTADELQGLSELFRLSPDSQEANRNGAVFVALSPGDCVRLGAFLLAQSVLVAALPENEVYLDHAPAGPPEPEDS